MCTTDESIQTHPLQQVRYWIAVVDGPDPNAHEHLGFPCVFESRELRFSTCPFSGPNRHRTGIASPLCFDRLPSHISKMVVSTVNLGGLELTEGRTVFELRMGL